MHTDSKEELQNKRHSLAHALGAALVALYPGTKLAIGPATADGFYYDAALPVSLSVDDLPSVERKMREILAQWSSFERRVVSSDEAREQFKDNPYKLELIEEFAGAGKDISLYTSGSFTDLCGGGHVDAVSSINLDGFSLDAIAGAYWRGDEHNTMLTRVYGLAFDSGDALSEYRLMREEAKKRDHRKLGKELGLFTFSPLVGSGLPLFTPKGTALRRALEDALGVLLDRYGYERVWIPHIGKADLYKTSGHWDKFGDDLFTVQGRHDTFVLKPMNCPHHTQIYASAPRSYRDLPIRYAEFTTNYRDEQKGELLGLTRVVSLTQDDGHIFCTEEQLSEEIASTIALIKEFYTALGFFRGNDCTIQVALRGDDTDKYLGDDTVWERAETVLRDALSTAGLPYEGIPGEAAFYGPKIDFMFHDSLNRTWQLATVQLDFVTPERFDLVYTAPDSSKRTPIMIHRAISGSIERFLGIMIEHFAGNFPFFLAPVQGRVLSVNADTAAYARRVSERFKQAGLRVDYDVDDERIGKKIAKVHAEKIPVRLVVGAAEERDGTVALETSEGKQILSVADAIANLVLKHEVFAVAEK